jgi:hypothetical protein
LHPASFLANASPYIHLHSLRTNLTTNFYCGISASDEATFGKQDSSATSIDMSLRSSGADRDRDRVSIWPLLHAEYGCIQLLNGAISPTPHSPLLPSRQRIGANFKKKQGFRVPSSAQLASTKSVEVAIFC